MDVPVRRVVPNLTVSSPREAARLYESAFGMEVVMDHGWITTVAVPGAPAHQLGLMSRDRTAAVNPSVSLEVDDVDAAFERVREAGLEIVHPLGDEEWGVRRFFFRDADGSVVNVLSHR